MLPQENTGRTIDFLNFNHSITMGRGFKKKFGDI